MNIIYRNIQEWEQAKPDRVTYDRFFQKRGNGKVSKVYGHIKCQVRIKNANSYKTVEGTKEVRWDAMGRAYKPTSNMRVREYDIKFK